ncbi:MAG: response regulator transcription factor [Nitrospira sp.]|nr:response regulator transcription factor [Nitrospira sp.]
MKPIRIVIADDHQLVVHGLQQLLEQDFQVVGTTTNGRAVLHKIKQLKPDVLLLDIAMPNFNGFQVAQSVHHSFPSLPIIFVTMHQEPPYITEAFRVGIKGYVLKHSAVTELKTAIKVVINNRRFLSSHIPRPLREQILAKARGAPIKDLSGKLTARQKIVFTLLAQGLSTQAVAKKLGITSSCVAFHKGNIKKNLGIHSLAELTRYAIEHGYVSSG